MNGCLVPIVILQEDMTLRQSWLWLNIRVFQGRLTAIIDEHFYFTLTAVSKHKQDA
jgi:hypothetical protein